MPRLLQRLGLTPVDLRLIGLTLAIKVALLAFGVAALAIHTGWVPNLFEPWDRWDAPHFTDLAVFGYGGDSTVVRQGDGYRSIYPGDQDLYIVFFPLYPWLIAAVDTVVRDPVLAAFVVTTVASLVVAPLLYRLVAIELGSRVAALAAWFLLVFPTAWVLHIGYTESLFLGLALGSLWMARTNRWWVAGLLAALATLTRVNGLVLGPALAVEALVQWWPERRWRWGWLAIGGVAVGFVGYLALNVAIYGNPFAFAEVQRDHWYKSLTAPWDGIAGITVWLRAVNPDERLMLGWMELAFVGLGLIGTVVSAVRFRPTWTAWMAGNWLLFVSTGFVLSVPRYSLVLFGLFAWFAVMTNRWPVVGVILSIGSVALFGFFAWRFAVGLWAF